MNIKRLVTNPIGENCYLVWDDTLECAIIDCGAWGEQKEQKIAQFVTENHLKPQLALQTHMHFDHILGLPFLHRQYGLSPLCHAEEQQIYETAPTMARDWFGILIPTPLLPIQEYIVDGQNIPLGNTRLQVIHTPGHTPGGVMFYHPESKVLFSGDTLFQGSIGRTDHLGGDMEQEIQSIQARVLELPDEVIVYPGHGPATTVGEEKLHNPYIIRNL